MFILVESGQIDERTHETSHDADLGRFSLAAPFASRRASAAALRLLESGAAVPDCGVVVPPLFMARLLRFSLLDPS